MRTNTHTHTHTQTHTGFKCQVLPLTKLFSSKRGVAFIQNTARCSAVCWLGMLKEQRGAARAHTASVIKYMLLRLNQSSGVSGWHFVCACVLIVIDIVPFSCVCRLLTVTTCSPIRMCCGSLWWRTRPLWLPCWSPERPTPTSGAAWLHRYYRRVHHFSHLFTSFTYRAQNVHICCAMILINQTCISDVSLSCRLWSISVWARCLQVLGFCFFTNHSRHMDIVLSSSTK